MTEPEKQDPEYFEKLARKLPLGLFSCKLSCCINTFYIKHVKKIICSIYNHNFIYNVFRQTLRLDENYIDALGKLYYEKIGSERDLGLKAADNLVIC